MTMKDDLANRSTDIHWPPGFDPLKADLFSHNELFIKASCERVWQHIIEAPKWPQWYPNSGDVRIVKLDEKELHLSPDRPLMFNGSLKMATIIWRRAKANV